MFDEDLDFDDGNYEDPADTLECEVCGERQAESETFLVGKTATCIYCYDKVCHNCGDITDIDDLQDGRCEYCKQEEEDETR